jgi:hypothetical protein
MESAMDEVDRPVRHGNILCFADQLRWETDPARQDTLKRLLIEEENRFGAADEHLRIVELRLADGAERIARQRRLIAELKNGAGDAASAERLLRTFEMIQDLFERFRDQVYHARKPLRRRRRHP